MLKQKMIKELLNEEACSHNQEKTKTCNKPTPGATSGGCAFEGAQISLFPYADAIHLVHGPQTCLNSSWQTRLTPTSYKGIDHTKMGFTTSINLNDIIFGADTKLARSIEYIIRNHAPRAIFVYATCVTSLVGDDIDAVCKEARKKYSIPIVPVHAPGFSGSKNLGSRLAGEHVLEHLIGTKEPALTTPFDINLIGEYNVTGDMWQYRHLLEELGIRILSTLSGDGRVEEICYAHRAKLNVIVCAKSLISLCEKMKKRYDIPYISVSFYGKRDTSASILAIAKALKNEALYQKARILIQREEQKLERALRPFQNSLKGKKAVLNTGGNKSWSFVSALQDIGLEVVATSVRKATLSDKEKAKEYLGKTGVLMQNPATEQANIIEKTGAHLLLAGGRSLYTALKKGVAFVDVNQEKELSYGAYAGLLNFAQDVKNSLENPVFNIVTKEAPWKQ